MVMARNPKEEVAMSPVPARPAPDCKIGPSPFKQQHDEMAEEEEEFDQGLQQLEKKRRLSSEQVTFLERSFEAENKLESERKLQIAKRLGLQPRQIAVWFQNRRARGRMRQLEHDFKALKTSYDAIVKENEKLQAQVASINALLNKKCSVQGQDFGTVVTQEQAIPLLSAVNVSSKSPEESSDNMEELSSKSEVDSPTKSDQSEVLDSGYYLPASDMFHFFDPDGLLECMCSPVFLQSVAVKIEESIFQEENLNFPFTLDEPILFPCYS